MIKLIAFGKLMKDEDLLTTYSKPQFHSLELKDGHFVHGVIQENRPEPEPVQDEEAPPAEDMRLGQIL